MICDLLNLTSMPCTDPAIYSNKQRQQKIESASQSDQLKRVSLVFYFYKRNFILKKGLKKSFFFALIIDKVDKH